MLKKAIPNSPGYFITDCGKVFNSNNRQMKTWFSTDGYERIRLTSLTHNKRVNRTVHLLVAEAFLKDGKYTNELQVNHIDGNKKNNNVSNLELVTGTENVNHAHNNELYTYDMPITMKNILTGNVTKFRSLREICRYLKVSLNFIRPRIIISNKYPLYNKFLLDIDYYNYLNHISKIKNNKTIYVYSHITNTHYVLTAYVQISILFGISYINVGKILNKHPEYLHYIGGYTFSLLKLGNNVKYVNKEQAVKDRDVVWKKLAIDTHSVGRKYARNDKH